MIIYVGVFEDLTRQSYLFGKSNFSLPFDPIRENGLLITDAKWNGSWSE